MSKIWKVKKQLFEDEIKQLLYNRGIIDSTAQNNKVEKFLNPNFETDFHDPRLLPDYQIFEDRISQALSKGEKIGIFADYDADGIPGAAFLHRSLNMLGAKTAVYIPTREEGYGLSRKGVDILIEDGCQLIITVDLGIKSFEVADYISMKKYDLIITDHHIPDEKIPNALAVINPKILSSKYPFTELSGAGVVLKLVQGLSQKYPKKLTEAFIKWNLDLIAISTISDVVPLVDENRLIAKYGLISLQKTKNLGLDQLYNVAAIDRQKINVYSVGFQIAPRINAPGRIDSASKSFELLVTDNKKEAEEMAVWLNDKNQDRQSAMDQVEEEAIAEIEKYKLQKNKIIVVYGNWPKGVVGPTANRLVDRYNRPVIILSRDGDFYSGSSRSISGFNIVEGLKQTEKILETFGGHKGAAGLKLKIQNVEQFIKEITKIAAKDISDKQLLPQIDIDLEIDINQINLELFNRISKLEPFGLGNPRPIFLCKAIELFSFSFVGRENQHLKLFFKNNQQQFEAIYFSCQMDIETFINGKKYDIVFSPEINRWNGTEKVSLNILDLKFSG